MSNNFQSQFNQVIDKFVADVSALARRAAIESLQITLGKRIGSGNGSGNGHSAPGKRGSEELEALGAQFMKYVTANPGMRIEQINKELGTTTKDLALPIRKLTADGMIKTKGKRRSTTYFVGAKASS